MVETHTAPYRRKQLQYGENYDFRLDLIAIPMNINRQKLVLLRNVEHPKPGQFKSDADKLRQVCYF